MYRKRIYVESDNLEQYLRDNHFVDIQWYNSLYYINPYGVVISTNIIPKGKAVFMNCTPDKHWYLRVNLYKNWKSKTSKIHRLVAEAFMERLEWRNIINHKDFNKQNNHISNLEWCTIKENNIHSYTKPDRKRARAQLWKSWYLHHNSKAVYCYDKNMEYITDYGSLTEAGRMTWINTSSIMQCCKWNKKHSHAGWFIWRYQNV